MLSLRLALLDLATRHRLTPDTYTTLAQFAFKRGAPTVPSLSLRRATGMLAMLLCGLGVIFFFAANWLTRSPIPMFVGLQAAVLGALLGAYRFRPLRVPLALLGFLATGALLAYFGQHYQSGSGPWRLFAIWAGLSLPLAFACRSDVLWSAWSVVAITAISTWIQGFTQRNFSFREDSLGEQLLAILLACALCALLSRPIRRFTGAGNWSLNLGILYAVILTSGSGLSSLFHEGSSIYPLYFIVLAAAAGYFGLPAFDVPALSMCVLGLDTLIIGGMIKVAFASGTLIFALLVIGLSILATLYFSVSIIQSLIKVHNQESMP